MFLTALRIILSLAMAIGAGALLVKAIRSKHQGRALDISVRAADVALRPLTPADAPAVAAIIDDQVRRANGFTEEIADQFVREIAEERNGPGHAYAICGPTGDGIRGVLTLGNDRTAPYKPTVGLWIGPEYRGSGLGRAALRTAVETALAQGIDPLFAGTSVQNLAMRSIIESARATLVSESRHLLPDGSEINSCWYRFSARTSSRQR